MFIMSMQTILYILEKKMIKEQIVVNANELKTVADLFKIGMARDINEPLSKEGGLQINIGAGTYKKLLNTIPLNFPDYNADTNKIPYEDNSVDVIHCYHVLEHLLFPKFFLKEAERVLKVGGYINIVVPYYNSSLYASCLDHITMFNERTWSNTFNSYSYDNGTKDWRLKEHLNIIIGIEERNLALLTQLIKV